jgi:hypothetical protein
MLFFCRCGLNGNTTKGNYKHNVKEFTVYRAVQVSAGKDYLYSGFIHVHVYVGARGGVVVEALHYKPEGRGFDSRWNHWII